jgi:peptidoglycan LD-endopeptidase CwlK
MKKIDKLKPKVRDFAERLVGESRKVGIAIKITETLRTIAEQDRLYAQGRDKPGKIVTNCRGGESFHNYGVAFDFCPMKNGKADWNNLEQFEKVGRMGEALGLEWGGSWKKFPDRPHFQYTAGYSIKDFQQGEVDWGLYN